MTEVKKQENELLEARSFPLRNYLMKYVMPTVSQGLLECCRAKADDPVDFLVNFVFFFCFECRNAFHFAMSYESCGVFLLQAEYLLRNNFEDD